MKEGGKRVSVRVMKCEKDSTSSQTYCWLEDGRGLQDKECGQPLEAGKGKKTDSLSLQKGMELYRYLDFSPMRPISDLSTEL